MRMLNAAACVRTISSCRGSHDHGRRPRGASESPTEVLVISGIAGRSETGVQQHVRPPVVDGLMASQQPLANGATVYPTVARPTARSAIHRPAVPGALSAKWSATQKESPTPLSSRSC